MATHEQDEKVLLVEWQQKRAEIVERMLREAYAKRGIQLKPYLAGPRGDRFELVESHGLDDAVAIAVELLDAISRK